MKMQHYKNQFIGLNIEQTILISVILYFPDRQYRMCFFDTCVLLFYVIKYLFVKILRMRISSKSTSNLPLTNIDMEY